MENSVVPSEHISIGIPWLISGQADGPLAISALVVIALAALAVYAYRKPGRT